MNIEQNEYGATERYSLDNWAAEYAKKLFGTEASARKAADQTLSDSKADITRYASIEQAGLIKLQSKINNGVKTNTSGISVSETDGTAYIATMNDGGIKLDDTGDLCVDAATEKEVKAGTDEYKPVTPSVFKAGVENIVGKVSDIATLTAGDNANLIKNNLADAINNTITYLKTADNTKVGYIDLDNVELDFYDGTNRTVSTNGEAGIYLIIPNGKYSDDEVITKVEVSGMNSGKITFSDIALQIGKAYVLRLEKDNCEIIKEFDTDIFSIDIGDVSGINEIGYSSGTGEIELPTSLAAHISSTNNTIKRITSYKTTPVQTGIWINGTPVWRVTMPITKLSDLGFKGDGTPEGMRATEILLKSKAVRDMEKVIYINDALIFQNEATYSHEAFAENVSERSPGVYSLGEEEIDPATHVYGWIEFAADKSIVEVV